MFLKGRILQNSVSEMVTRFLGGLQSKPIPLPPEPSMSTGGGGGGCCTLTDCPFVWYEREKK